MNEHRIAQFLVLAFISGCGASPQPGVSSQDSQQSAVRGERKKPGEKRNEVLARPCRDDLFFIDIPLVTPVPSNAQLGAGIAATDVESDANTSGLPWFCDSSSCAVTSVSVELESVLAKRGEAKWRSDGHERFYRLRFIDDQTGGVAPILAKARCDAVDQIRDHFSNRMGVPPEDLFVGRVCDASSLGVPAYATEEMLNWHWDRMGLDPGARSGESRVDVALIDGGIEPAVSNSLETASSVDYSGDTSGALHPHGTAMAVLLKNVAQSASLHDLRVLDSGGAGIPADVARAFDHAFFEIQREGRPLVINLSLGWAPQLGVRATLTGPSCSTWEDPVGEPLRYLMHGTSGKVSVFSASGNQPTQVPSGVFPPPPSSPGLLPCGSGVAPDWFYPARWASEESCLPGQSSGRTAGAAVSGTTDEERAIVTAIPGGESPLVAPGQHVYAEHPAADPAPTLPTCNGTTIAAGFTSPMPLTGTSVAAALTSAAAARVQTVRADRTGAGFEPNTVPHILYAAGESLCRPSSTSDPVRRLDLARMERLLSEEEPCKQAVSCLRTLSNAPGANTLAVCGSQVQACLGPDSCATGQAVRWPDGFPEDALLCQQIHTPITFQNVSSCGASCPFESVPFRSVLGTTGPQPGGGGCLDCWGSVNQSVMMVMMDETSGPGVHQDPYVIVTGYDLSTLSTEQYYAALPVASIQGGQAMSIDVPFSALQMDWSTASITMTSTVVADGKQGTHFSPIRVGP